MTTRLDVLTRDDLFVDALAARRDTAGDPLAALLGAYAALADGRLLAVSPVAPVVGRRRFLRTGWLTTGLAALTVAASGVGVAAAVESPSAPWFGSRASSGASAAGQQIFAAVSAHLDALGPLAPAVAIDAPVSAAAVPSSARPGAGGSAPTVLVVPSGGAPVRVIASVRATSGPRDTPILAGPGPRIAAPGMPVPPVPAPVAGPTQPTVAGPTVPAAPAVPISPVVQVPVPVPGPVTVSTPDPAPTGPDAAPPQAGPGKGGARGGPKNRSVTPGSPAKPKADSTADAGSKASANSASKPATDSGGTAKRSTTPPGQDTKGPSTGPKGKATAGNTSGLSTSLTVGNTSGLAADDGANGALAGQP